MIGAWTMALLVVLFAEGDPPWWNYPGLELWKFVNLGIFIVAFLYFLRWLGVFQGLQTRKEMIARSLAEARRERDQALAQLAEVERRLEGLDEEIEAIRQKSKVEAEMESQRIQRATEDEIAKLKQNAQREIEAASRAAAAELRRFASDESIRLAEQIIRKEIRPEDDARLTKERAAKLGGTAS